MAADKLNTSGSIVISDDSSTDTDYEPSPKRSKLEELEAPGGGSSAGCSSVIDEKNLDNPGSEAPLAAPVPNSESPPASQRNNVTVLYQSLPPVSCSSPPLANQYRGQIFHTCNGSYTFEQLMENLDRDRAADEQRAPLRRMRRLGMRVVCRRSSNSNSQSQGEVQNVPNAEDEPIDEASDSDTSSTEPDNDEEEKNEIDPDPEGRNSIVASPDSNGYITDDMDSNEIDEIPSDLEFSPPRPLTPPRPFPRHRERRNAIFERRDPPPPPVTAREIEDHQFYHNEFEVASVSDINENPIEDANSTSGTENNLDSISEHNGTFVEASNLSDNHFADSETMKSDPEVNSDETHNSSVRSKGLNSSDSEISEKDKWFCSQCHAKCMPYLRYCLRCFKVRRNWLPKRPASRRLKRRKRAQRKSNPANTSKTSITSDSDDVVDGPPQRNSASNQSQQQSSSADPAANNALQLVDPCSSSQLRTVLPAGPAVNLNEGFLIDDENLASNRLTSNTPPGNRTLIEIFTPPESQSSNVEVEVTERSQKSDEETTEVDSPVPASSESQSTSSSQSQRSGVSQTSSQSQSTQSSGEFLSPPLPPGSKPNQPICNICFARTKNAAFVHNKVAHQYCCYVCADKILKRDGKCPICREKVLRVVKIIVV